MTKIRPEVVAEALETAADRFETGEVDWIQGDYYRRITRIVDVDQVIVNIEACAIGALCEATGEDWRHATHCPVTQLAASAMRPYIEDKVVAVVDHIDPSEIPHGMVIHFNDRVAKDKSEVIEVMKLAAKDLRNRA